jgi:anti-sigma B factor antagonist
MTDTLAAPTGTHDTIARRTQPAPSTAGRPRPWADVGPPRRTRLRDPELVQDRADWRTIILHLRGEWDLADAPRLSGAITGALRQGSSQLLVDLGDVGFADISILTALLHAHRLAGEAGSQLVVSCPPGMVRSAIEACGLDDVFPLVMDVEAGLDALGVER